MEYFLPFLFLQRRYNIEKKNYLDRKINREKGYEEHLMNCFGKNRCDILMRKTKKKQRMFVKLKKVFLIIKFFPFPKRMFSVSLF